MQGRNHGLPEFDDYSLYLPNATCLRMGNLGYKSEAQKSLFVCYNELQSYVDCLYKAMHEPYKEYEEIGHKKDGEYLQINTNLLQLENEFYSTIRPKRNVKSGERPLDALVNGGIEYVEVRALDLNPYLPLGIDSEEVRFLDTFLLHCLLSESPQCNESEFFEVAENLSKVVEHGRDPDLMLSEESQEISLRHWANDLLQDMAHSAALLDETHGTDSYNGSLQKQMAKVADDSLTPSGKMLQEMQENNLSFFEFSMNRSRAARDALLKTELSDSTLQEFKEASSQSLERQKEIEAAETQSFDDFLAEWNAQ